MRKNRLRFCSLFLAVVLLVFCVTPVAFASSGGGNVQSSFNIVTTNPARFKSSVYQQWVSFLGVLYDQTPSTRWGEILSFFPGVSGANKLAREDFISGMMSAVFEAQAALGLAGWVRSSSFFDRRSVVLNSVWTSSAHEYVSDFGEVICNAPFKVIEILTGVTISGSYGSDRFLRFRSKTVPSSDFSNWFETNASLSSYDSVSFYYLDLSGFAGENPSLYQFDGDLPLMNSTRYATLSPSKTSGSVDPSPSPSPSEPVVDQDKTKDKWLKYQGVYGVKGVAQIALDYNSLVAVCESNDLDPDLYIYSSHNGTQWVIVDGVPGQWEMEQDTWTPTSSVKILCDYQGRPYVCGKNAIVDQPLPYEPDPDTPEVTDPDQKQLIDLINQIIELPNGDKYYTENVYYDYDNRSYTTNLYNVTNNEYYTYNYSYTYFINYTSITYIGQTETYEAYSAYYNLPDGRSSDDLTAADLEQLSLVFQDVVPYARSADKLTLRRLFHFDGNTNDASYWSYIEPGFEWVSGASITYMDAGTFNGALYLDEQAHKFNINLPNVDLSGDFTLQFRYYQSATPAPSFDSTISAGSQTIMKLSGSAVQTGGGSSLFTMPVGTWNELCIMRSGDVLYYYLNGILQTNTQAVTGSLGSVFTFDFGSVQQTYKYFDELRVTREALYLDNGSPANYTPSSVPFDTNLTLVLPDEDVPIADEYVTVNGSENNLLSFDFQSGEAPSFSSVPSQFLSLSSDSNSATVFTWKSFWTSVPAFSFVLGGHVDLSSASDFVLSYTGSGSPQHSLSVMSSSGRTYGQIPVGLFLSLMSTIDSSLNATSVFTSSGTYCFSILDSSGASSQIVFSVATNSTPQQWTQVSYSPGSFSLALCGTGGAISVTATLSPQLYWHSGSYMSCCPVGLSVMPVSGDSVGILYAELVEGSEVQYSLEYHYATYSPEALKGSPVLAVQSNLVNQSKNESLYTIGNDVVIGGPRPSYPTRGMVWALVEDGYITSLQQYDGFGWNAVNGRIWTGERWVPYYSYNVLTLQDYYDIVGNDYNGNEYIYTESGFWSWWQKAWASFIVKFDKLVAALTGSSQIDDTLLPDAPDDGVDEDGEPTGGFTFVGLLGNLVTGTWGVVKGLVRIGGNTFSNFVSQLTWIPSGFDAFDPKSTDGIFYVETSPPSGGE